METDPEAYSDVVDALARDSFLRQIYSTTGACRIHCVGFAPNHRTLDHHVNHLFRSTKGIRTLSWHMLLSTLKDVDGGVEYEEYQKSEYMENRGNIE